MRLIDEQEYQNRIAQIPIEKRTFRKAWETAHEMPEIEVEPVRHGSWEYNDEGDPLCSVCGNSDELSRDDYYCRGGKIRDSDSAYCPWCGAKMDGGDSS